MGDNRIKFMRCREGSVIPSKARDEDTGYDLTLIGIEKELPNGVTLYQTGIKAKPPEGYYLDLVARSSLTKTGYIMAHSVGIIDQTYRGEIFVPLMKIDLDSRDLAFPVKLCQLIPRMFHHFEIEEVDSLDETDRSSGGFGSTDSIKK